MFNDPLINDQMQMTLSYIYSLYLLYFKVYDLIYYRTWHGNIGIVLSVYLLSDEPTSG